VKVTSLGKLISFNPNTGDIHFRENFLTPELINVYEDLVKYEKPIKHSFKSVKPFRSKTYQQQKKFWVDSHKILKAQKININTENMNIYYRFIKENIFPVKYVDFGFDENGRTKRMPYVPEMKELTWDEMDKVINDLHEYYDYLGIDWDKII